MAKNVFFMFNGSAAHVHKNGTAAANAIRRALQQIEKEDSVIVTYCAATTMPYTVKFKVTTAHVVIESPPSNATMDKELLQTEECQEHLHNLVKAALEV